MLRIFPIRTQHHKKIITTAAYPAQPIPLFSLNRCLVCEGGNGLRGHVGEGDGAGLAGHQRLTLDLDGGTGSASGLLLLGILLDTAQEVVAGSRGADVLDADVQALLEVAVVDLLIDDNTDGGLGDVVDDTSLAVVDLEGHTLLDGTVDLDIDNITDAVLAQVRGHSQRTLLAEVAAEGIAGARSLSVGVTHFV